MPSVWSGTSVCLGRRRQEAQETEEKLQAIATTSYYTRTRTVLIALLSVFYSYFVRARGSVNDLRDWGIDDPNPEQTRTICTRTAALHEYNAKTATMQQYSYVRVVLVP